MKTAYTQTYIKKLLFYNSKTGIFIWLPRKITKKGDIVFNARRAGKPAGCVLPNGYRVMSFPRPGRCNKIMRAHRLAFLYMTGSIPQFVDHIDQNPDNNTWKNLRSCTQQENCKNARMSINNTSGCTGVSRQRGRGRGKWLAQIQVNGISVHLGSFTDIVDAITARKAAEIKYNYHPNHGRSK